MTSNSTPVQYALIVDADPLQRAALAELVSELNLHCVEAEDGHAAIARMHEQMPAIIILNMTVAGAETVIAYETRQSIPALSGIPVVALAAFRSTAADWRGLRGVFPVGDTLYHTPEDLRALIKGALNSPF